MKKSLTLATAAWLLLGCAAPLENPEEFQPPDGSSGPSGTEGCDLDVRADILEPRCATSGCHGASSSAAGLDLTGSDLALHLYEVESMGCAGRMLIDADSPDDSYLLERVGDAPECDGEPIEQMPLGAEPLTAEEQSCLRAWVRDAVARMNGAS